MARRSAEDVLSRFQRWAHECPVGGGTVCIGCREMCSFGYPGRFTPTEAAAAIERGRGDQLIAVTYAGVTVLRPSIVGWEEGDISEVTMRPGQCTFLSASGTCDIHASGFKPLECRTAVCASSGRTPTAYEVDVVVRAIELMWDTSDGAAVVSQWRAERS